MKKIALLFIVSFIFYITGHMLWSFAIVCEEPLFFNAHFEEWIINIPFGLFAIFGLLASIRLYQLKQ